MPIDLCILPIEGAPKDDAEGEFTYDNGKDTETTIEQGAYESYRFGYDENSLRFIKVNQNPSVKASAILGDIWIYNWTGAAPSSVSTLIDGGATASYKFEVVKEKKALHIIGQNHLYSKVLQVQIKV